MFILLLWPGSFVIEKRTPISYLSVSCVTCKMYAKSPTVISLIFFCNVSILTAMNHSRLIMVLGWPLVRTIEFFVLDCILSDLATLCEIFIKT